MNETIGSRIAKYRKAKGLTQEALANLLGVSSQAVSKWENDSSCPDISLLPALCDALGISTDTLLTGKSEIVRLLPEKERKPLEALTLRIKVISSDGDKVRVNLPMSLIKVCMDMGFDIGSFVGTESKGGVSLSKLDIQKIMDMVEQGMIGRLVEIESADGDTVEVVVE